MVAIESYIQLSGPLFEEVQTRKVFSDPKTFVDAIPLQNPDLILENYHHQKTSSTFDLKQFVVDHFSLPKAPVYTRNQEQSFENYLIDMWNVLLQDMSSPPLHSTLISLPHPHPVPGERFREGFYWDTYFAALGLAALGKIEELFGIVENFVSLIERFGFIPNGNRVYFLSRSQPPIFSLLLKLLQQLAPACNIERYFPFLEKEYLFWMGQNSPSLFDEKCSPSSAIEVEGQLFLNRYWDELNTPRPEAYLQEKMARQRNFSPHFYRQRRAVCASGWDFSSRWLRDPSQEESLYSLDLLPIDLNSFLYHAESTLREFAGRLQNKKKENQYARLAKKRKKELQARFWDKKKGFFFDYNWREKKLSSSLTLAGVMPLFVKAATSEQARIVANRLKKTFLLEGGFVTSLQETEHQWDYPNGWAPLQWIAISGLLQYGHVHLAKEGAQKWLSLNQTIYEREGVMMEKYNVVTNSIHTTKGLYHPQRGFGWTNGVALALQKLLAKLG